MSQTSIKSNSTFLTNFFDSNCFSVNDLKHDLKPKLLHIIKLKQDSYIPLFLDCVVHILSTFSRLRRNFAYNTGCLSNQTYFIIRNSIFPLIWEDLLNPMAVHLIFSNATFWIKSVHQSVCYFSRTQDRVCYPTWVPIQVPSGITHRVIPLLGTHGTTQRVIPPLGPLT